MTDPNTLLAAARGNAKLTQLGLAELANAQVEAHTGRPGAMDADYIGKLERGIIRWPGKSYRDALRTVLRVKSDRQLGFFNPRSVVATVDDGPRGAEEGDDVKRKQFLRALTGSVAGLAVASPLVEFAARAAGSSGRRVGESDVEQVRQVARMYASQDHRFGGALSATAVIAQLWVSAELTDGSFSTERVRAELFSAVAELADTAAGVCFDAGLHDDADRAFRFGVGCATEAKDWALRAKALSGLANLAVHQGHADDALSFAETALVRADRLPPLVAAMIHTRHARALGAIGIKRSADCRTAVDRAQALFDAADPEDVPGWVGYYDRAHLDRDSGRALLHLALNGGEHEEARRRLDISIAGFPRGYSRGKALAQANLAALTMARDDPHHGVTLGNDALAAVEGVRSDRVYDALKRLAEAGRQHRALADVRDLNRRIKTVLASETAV